MTKQSEWNVRGVEITSSEISIEKCWSETRAHAHAPTQVGHAPLAAVLPAPVGTAAGSRCKRRSRSWFADYCLCKHKENRVCDQLNTERGVESGPDLACDFRICRILQYFNTALDSARSQPPRRWRRKGMQSPNKEFDLSIELL